MLFNYISLLASALLVVFISVGCTTVPVPESEVPLPSAPPSPSPEVLATAPPVSVFKAGDALRPTTYAALPGWDKDDLREAWPAFLISCEVLVKKVEWREPCVVAREVNGMDGKAIRTFFEAFFSPHQVLNFDGSDSGLVTGYYEPLLQGARKRGGAFQTPLHRVPEDMLPIDLSGIYPELKTMRLRGRLDGKRVVPYYSRAELMQTNSLVGKELLWVDDPIEAFFLQVQGSGRVYLSDSKETVRVAYADQNGHPYKSIGRYLVDKGEMTLEQASAQSIKAWYVAHPLRRQELLNANPSYVFFKEEKLIDPKKGPKGSLGVPLTPQRSIAIDPQFIPLGVPIFLATTQPNSEALLQRLVLAQDTGGAIKNAVRADFFWGFGKRAGEQAGKMKQRGKMWVLLPKVVQHPSE
jgi:membrane-bound lytic murein transglycosylase A